MAGLAVSIKGHHGRFRYLHAQEGPWDTRRGGRSQTFLPLSSRLSRRVVALFNVRVRAHATSPHRRVQAHKHA